jgi:hypothetical protein
MRWGRACGRQENQAKGTNHRVLIAVVEGGNGCTGWSHSKNTCMSYLIWWIISLVQAGCDCLARAATGY